MDIDITQTEVTIYVHGAVSQDPNAGPGLESYGTVDLYLKQNDTGKQELLSPGKNLQEFMSNIFYEPTTVSQKKYSLF